MGNDKYNHQELYKKATNLMKPEDYMAWEEKYESAQVDALSVLRGKKARDYASGLELMTDALIKFRKSSKHPHASEDASHRYIYADEVKQFLEAYKRQARIDDDGLEKLLQTATGRRRIMQAFMDNEQQTLYDKQLDYALEKIVPKHDDTIKSIAEYHLEQNPALKKDYSGKRKAQLKTNRDALMDELKGYHQKNLEVLLRDYQEPKDKPK